MHAWLLVNAIQCFQPFIKIIIGTIKYGLQLLRLRVRSKTIGSFNALQHPKPKSLCSHSSMAELSNIQTDGPDGKSGWFSVIRENLRTILGFPSAIVGMAFLAISSFSEKQFVGNQSLQIVVFVVFTGLFVAFIFSARSINSCLGMVCHWHFSLKAVIQCLLIVIVSMLAFLIKYPRFNIHSALTNSTCIHGEERKEIFHENQFNLFSVGAFSLLAILISSERQKPIQLGFSSLLIGLTIDTSMDIPGRDGPNLWYMLGAALYCIFLIFMKHYIDSLESTRSNTLRSNKMSERPRGIFLELLKLFSAAFGIVCLFFCPFSKNQFGNDTAVLGVSFFIIFALLLGYFMSKTPGFISYMANQCHDKRLVKAMVSSLLLMILSVVIFLTKYPRFQIHSKHKESCADQKKEKKSPHRSRFDLYSAAAFSLAALTISSGTEQSVELGIFNFLLELTMDASIEILENKAPNIWFMLGAAVYCVVLIFARIYLAPAETRYSTVGHQQGDNGSDGGGESKIKIIIDGQQPESGQQGDDRDDGDGGSSSKTNVTRQQGDAGDGVSSSKTNVTTEGQQLEHEDGIAGSLQEDKHEGVLVEDKPENKSERVLLEDKAKEELLKDKPKEETLLRRRKTRTGTNTEPEKLFWDDDELFGASPKKERAREEMANEKRKKYASEPTPGQASSTSGPPT